MKLSKLQLEFIDLLKTTDQPQGRGTLCSADGFCCLGLWTVHRGVPVDYAETLKSDGNTTFKNRRHIMLSPELANELGVISQSDLMNLNDIERLSFKQIAEVVEANPEEYFKEIA